MQKFILPYWSSCGNYRNIITFQYESKDLFYKDLNDLYKRFKEDELKNLENDEWDEELIFMGMEFTSDQVDAILHDKELKSLEEFYNLYNHKPGQF